MNAPGHRNRVGRFYPERLAAFVIPLIFLAPLAMSAIAARIVRGLRRARGNPLPRLVWAGVPLLSLAYSSRAMRAAGFTSRTVVNARYRTADVREFDQHVEWPFRMWPGLNTLATSMRAAWLFSHSMFSADVLHCFFNGGMLGRTALARFEFRLWKLAGGRLVLFPYGSDAFVYRRLPDTAWARALAETYPRTEAEDAEAERRVDFGCRMADAVVGCLVHDVGLPRVDYHPLLWYPCDVAIQPAYREPGPVIRVAHAANHPGIKGTLALSTAIDELREEGVGIELDVVVQGSRADVLRAFATADIVVDQLLFGYALAAIEAMALSKPVISGLGDDPLYRGYRQRGQLDSVPVVAASPETIKGVLAELVADRDRLKALAIQSRTFVEREHGPARTVEIFRGIYADLGCIR